MKLSNKITIDLEAFFATGKFDVLKLGKTKDWVIHNFPDPDGLSDFPKIFQDDIWRYGNIELHFSQDQLFMIFSDYIEELDGGESLVLQKSFLEDKEKRTLARVISALNRRHIDFRKRTNTMGDITVNLELESGVVLGFYLEENSDESYEEYHERGGLVSQGEFQLCSFHLSGG